MKGDNAHVGRIMYSNRVNNKGKDDAAQRENKFSQRE
jgi:hypothetical protein